MESGTFAFDSGGTRVRAGATGAATYGVVHGCRRGGGQDGYGRKAEKARVWDNDNIPKAGDEISVVGQAIPDQSNSSAAPTADAGSGITPAAAPGDKDKEKKDEGAVEEGRTDKDARVAAAKEKLDSLKKDLDLAQRRLTLDSQMYYSKPDYQTDPEGAEQLKSEKDQVAAKQDEVDAAQKELDALEAELVPVWRATEADNSGGESK